MRGAAPGRVDGGRDGPGLLLPEEEPARLELGAPKVAPRSRLVDTMGAGGCLAGRSLPSVSREVDVHPMATVDEPACGTPRGHEKISTTRPLLRTPVVLPGPGACTGYPG